MNGTVGENFEKRGKTSGKLEYGVRVVQIQVVGLCDEDSDVSDRLDLESESGRMTGTGSLSFFFLVFSLKDDIEIEEGDGFFSSSEYNMCSSYAVRGPLIIGVLWTCDVKFCRFRIFEVLS